MDRETFLSPGSLVELTGIPARRLEQQLQRRGANPEASPDMRELPISKAEAGKHPRYNFVDALTLASVVEMERCGVAFDEGLRLIKNARLSVFPTTSADLGDMWFAAWSDGMSERDAKGNFPFSTVFGSFQQVAQRLPSDRPATISLNVSQVARHLETKLRAMGIERVGFRLLVRETLL